MFWRKNTFLQGLRNFVFHDLITRRTSPPQFNIGEEVILTLRFQGPIMLSFVLFLHIEN